MTYVVRSSNELAISSFTDIIVIENERSDYRYRVFLTSDQYDRFMENVKTTIDYENFKDSIDDDTVHKLVYETWLSRKRLYE